MAQTVQFKDGNEVLELGFGTIHEHARKACARATAEDKQFYLLFNDIYVIVSPNSLASDISEKYLMMHLLNRSISGLLSNSEIDIIKQSIKTS